MEENMINWPGIAQFGYEAYAESSGGKNYEGKPMPKWDELPEAIRLHWARAAQSMCEVFGRAMTA